MITNNVLFKESKNAELWKKIRDDDAYATYRQNLADAWKQTEETTLAPLTFSLFMMYEKNGSRKEYSKEYVARRLALNSSFMSYMIYREKKYLDMLEEVIMLICDEYTWSDSGHLGTITDSSKICIYIDLFAAETGHALSEILYILGDELDPRVSSRIRYEVQRRIIDSFMNNNYSFEQSFSNWATVCAGSVGMAFLYRAPDKFPLIKERIKSCFNNYLVGFGNDGICAEGPGYWVYGFGYYTYFEELYKDFTGEYMIPLTEKQHKIAMFLQNVHIAGHRVISFSDGSDKEFLMNGLVCRVNEIYGDDVRVLPEDAYAPPVMGGDNCYRFAHCIRNFLWYRPDKVKEAKKSVNETVYFEDAQWFIRRCDNYFFAAKGGRNDDPHNHNDIGSFLISDYKSQLLADLGKGEYDKFYFAPETRYNNLCCSSLGHSVPVIAGCGQKPGSAYKAKNIEHSDNFFALDISDAYGISELESLKRSFELGDENITITDKVVMTTQKVWTDRLVSVIEPEVCDDGLKIGKMKITNNCNIIPEISTSEMKNHTGGGVYTVYLIDYKTDASEIRFELSL